MCDPVSVSVCHKLVFCRNTRTDRAGFCQRGGFFQPHRTRCYKEIQDFQVSTTVRLLQSGILSSTAEILKILPRHVDHPNVLSTYLDKGGRPECDKLSHYQLG